MRKILILLVYCFAFCSFACAKDTLHVSALDDFDTENPSEYFQAKLLADGEIDGIYMIKGDILKLELKKVTDPTRAKRDAKIYFELTAYEDSKGEHKFQNSYVAKYSKSALNKEEIQKIPPKTVAKKAATTVGNFFVSGFSYAFNFVDGAKENSQNNRLKSGVKNAYEKSVFSYVEYGSEVQIKKGDEFYFKIKKL